MRFDVRGVGKKSPRGKKNDNVDKLTSNKSGHLISNRRPRTSLREPKPKLAKISNEITFVPSEPIDFCES